MNEWNNFLGNFLIFAVYLLVFEEFLEIRKIWNLSKNFKVDQNWLFCLSRSSKMENTVQTDIMNVLFEIENFVFIMKINK